MYGFGSTWGLERISMALLMTKVAHKLLSKSSLPQNDCSTRAHDVEPPQVRHNPRWDTFGDLYVGRIHPTF